MEKKYSASHRPKFVDTLLNESNGDYGLKEANAHAHPTLQSVLVVLCDANNMQPAKMPANQLGLKRDRVANERSRAHPRSHVRRALNRLFVSTFSRSLVQFPGTRIC